MRDTWLRKRGLLLGLAVLFLVLPFAFHLVRPSLETLYLVRAEKRVQECSRESNSEACYARILESLKRRAGYPRLADLCSKTRDPACYRAYGSAVPNPYMCAYVRKDGLYALHTCYLGNFSRR